MSCGECGKAYELGLREGEEQARRVLLDNRESADLLAMHYDMGHAAGRRGGLCEMGEVAKRIWDELDKITNASYTEIRPLIETYRWVGTTKKEHASTAEWEAAQTVAEWFQQRVMDAAKIARLVDAEIDAALAARADVTVAGSQDPAERKGVAVGHAEGRREMAEEAIRAVETADNIPEDPAAILVDTIRALAARDDVAGSAVQSKHGGAKEPAPGSEPAATEGGAGSTVEADSNSAPSAVGARQAAGAPDSPSYCRYCGRLVPAQAWVDGHYCGALATTVYRSKIGGVGTSPPEAGHGERRPDEVDSCSPAGAPDSLYRQIRDAVLALPAQDGTPLWAVVDEEARRRLDLSPIGRRVADVGTVTFQYPDVVREIEQRAARAVRDRIASAIRNDAGGQKVRPGSPYWADFVRDHFDDADLAAILARAKGEK